MPERVRLGLLKPNVEYDCDGGGEHVVRYVPPSQQRREPLRWCSRQCAGAARSGDNHPAWRGGRIVEPDGYVKVHRPEHPAAVSGYVPEHRLVMEAHLGRYLSAIEVVHHEDEVPGHNDLSNLRLFPDQAAHKRHHEAGRVRDTAGRYLPKAVGGR